MIIQRLLHALLWEYIESFHFDQELIGYSVEVWVDHQNWKFVFEDNRSRE